MSHKSQTIYRKFTFKRITYNTTSRINYSTCGLPHSVLVIDKLDNKDSIQSFRDMLKNRAGVYYFINTIDNKRYIGSAKNLYIRLLEHLTKRKSNKALQSAIAKHGLANFNFGVFEYLYLDDLQTNKALTDLETSYIQKFDFNLLYNFMKTATSLTGYKHTEEARLKMALRFKNKLDHPMYGKSHSKEALSLISKPGKLNPMYGKVHSDFSRKKISDRLSKHINGVGIYDLNDNLILKFRNNVELAKHLKISKVTVGKYLNSGFVYKKIYRFKVNNI